MNLKWLKIKLMVHKTFETAEIVLDIYTFNNSES